MAGFTAIAAGVGAAATAGGMGMNFADAAKQKDMRLKAEEDSAKMMDEARRKVSVNPFAAISLPTEAYKLESEAMLQQGAQLTEAGRESERGAAATAGRVQMAQQQGQQQIRAEMGKDLTSLEMAKAKEEASIRDKMAGLDLAEAEGAQKAAADAAIAQAELKQAAVQGAADLAGKAAAAAPLFEKSSGARQFEKFGKDYQSMIESGNVPKQLMGADGKPLSAANAYAKMTMTPDQYSKLGQTVTKKDASGKEYESFDVNPFKLGAAVSQSPEQTRTAREALKASGEKTAFDRIMKDESATPAQLRQASRYKPSNEPSLFDLMQMYDLGYSQVEPKK